MKKLIILLACGVFLGGTGAIAGDVFFDVGCRVNMGYTDGFIQVPVGGKRTSLKRPTTEELGIDWVRAYEFYGNLGIKKHSIYAIVDFLSLKGNTTFKQDLLTHGKLFRTGSSAKSNIQLDTYHLGYQYKIPYKNLTFSPSVGVTLFNFDYSLRGEKYAHRGYMKTAAHLRLQITWQPYENFTICLDGLNTLPLPDSPIITRVGLQGEYRMWDKKTKGYAVSGIGYNRIEYEGGNKHKIHNHTLVNIGPMMNIGFKIMF